MYSLIWMILKECDALDGPKRRKPGRQKFERRIQGAARGHDSELTVHDCLRSKLIITVESTASHT